MADETLHDDARPAEVLRDGLPVSSASDGTLPGVDLCDSAGLLDIMEGLQ